MTVLFITIGCHINRWPWTLSRHGQSPQVRWSLSTSSHNPPFIADPIVPIVYGLKQFHHLGQQPIFLLVTDNDLILPLPPDDPVHLSQRPRPSTVRLDLIARHQLQLTPAVPAEMF